jgi:hypothetical protein
MTKHCECILKMKKKIMIPNHRKKTEEKYQSSIPINPNDER